MRKKLIMILLLLVLLLVLIMTRCGGKKDRQGETETSISAQQGGTEVVRQQKLGTVTQTEDGCVQITTEENGESVDHVFTDLKMDDWCVPAVNFVVTNGLMGGTDAGGGKSQFRPNYGMSRAQLAMILYRFADGEPVSSPRSYADVTQSDWNYDCVNWADANGYIKALDGENFGAEEYCSCEQVLTILYRLAGSPSSNAALEDYPYAAKVGEYHLSAVRWAWEKGLIAEDECVWYPTQAISRAQTALLLMRYDLLIGAPEK